MTTAGGRHDEIIEIIYTFAFEGGAGKTFNLRLKSDDLILIPENLQTYPAWTRLSFKQCPNCRFVETTHEYCPIARNLVPVIDFFGEHISHEKTSVVVETRERTYRKDTTLQKGLSSMLGIVMVSSGCAIMEKLKPLVRYHLPFATIEETSYRVITMYLLIQHFLDKRGRKSDQGLKEISGFYKDIQVVNRHFCDRLNGINIKDASVNAIVLLSNFGNFLTLAVRKNMLDDLEAAFAACLE